MNGYEWLSKQMDNVSKANAEQTATIAALEADKQKLIEALAKIASRLNIEEVRKCEDRIGFHPEEIVWAIEHARALLAEIRGNHA